jgi:hypothetical protein
MGGLMSTVKANDLTNTTGGIPTVKGQDLIPTAWVNFNGTGTVAIRDSEGVSSITDNATGRYTVNYAVALANTNYCVSYTVGGVSGTTGDDSYGSLTPLTVNGVYVRNRRYDGNSYDININMVTVMGGQA